MADRARKEAETYTSDLMDFVRTADITITDEDKHREALSKAEEMEAMQDSETATLGQTFIRDANKANAFSKLSRYETTIERSLFKPCTNSSAYRPPEAPEATFLRPWP